MSNKKNTIYTRRYKGKRPYDRYGHQAAEFAPWPPPEPIPVPGLEFFDELKRLAEERQRNEHAQAGKSE